MANTYSQIYIQVIFAVKGRQKLLRKEIRAKVFQYISGIIKAKGQKPIIVNGVDDHIHIFIGLKPSMKIADLVRDIKNNSSKFINENRLLPFKFEWQSGYGVFSYSQSQIGKVFDYILNQETYHKRHSFKDEYIDLLKKHEVDYDFLSFSFHVKVGDMIHFNQL